MREKSLKLRRWAVVAVMVGALLCSALMLAVPASKSKAAGTANLDDKLLVRYSADSADGGKLAATDKDGNAVTAADAAIVGSASTVNGVEGESGIRFAAGAYAKIEGNLGLPAAEKGVTYSFWAKNIVNDFNAVIEANPDATSSASAGLMFNAGTFVKRDKWNDGWHPVFPDAYGVTYGENEGYWSMIVNALNPHIQATDYYYYTISAEADTTAETGALKVYRDGKLTQTWDCSKAFNSIAASAENSSANAYEAVVGFINAFRSDNGVIGIRKGNVAGDMLATTEYDDFRFYAGALTDSEVADLYAEISSVLPKTIDASDNVAGEQTITNNAGFDESENFSKIILRANDTFPKLLINGATDVTVADSLATGTTADGAAYTYSVPAVVGDIDNVIVTLNNGMSANKFTVTVSRAKATYLKDLKVSYTAGGGAESASVEGFLPTKKAYTFTLPATAESLAFLATPVGAAEEVDIRYGNIPATDFAVPSGTEYTITVSDNTGAGVEAETYTVKVSRPSSAAVTALNFGGAAINGFDPNNTNTTQTLTVRQAIAAGDAAKFSFTYTYNDTVTGFDTPVYDDTADTWTFTVKDLVCPSNTAVYTVKFVVNESAGSAGLDDKLLMRYKLDDTAFRAYDKSGTEIAAAKGAVTGTVTNTNGMEGEAAAQFGNRGYATATLTSGAAGFTGDAVSLSFWGSDLGANAWTGLFQFLPTGGAGANICVGVYQGLTSAGSWNANYFTPSSGDTATILNLEGYHHVTMTVTSVSVSTYIDGEFKYAYNASDIGPTYSAIVNTLKTGGRLGIRRSWDSAGMPAGVKMDDLRFYGAALSAAEVTALYEEVSSVLVQSVKVGTKEATVFTAEEIAAGTPSSSSDWALAYTTEESEPEVVVTFGDGTLAKLVKGEVFDASASTGARTYKRAFTVKNGLSNKTIIVSYTVSDADVAKKQLSDLKVGGKTVDGFTPAVTEYTVSVGPLETTLPAVSYTLMSDIAGTTVQTTDPAGWNRSGGWDMAIDIFLAGSVSTPDNTYTITFVKESAAEISALNVSGSKIDVFDVKSADSQNVYVSKIPALADISVTLTYTGGGEIDAAKSSVNAETGAAVVYVKDTVNLDDTDVSLDKTFRIQFKVQAAGSEFYFDKTYFDTAEKTVDDMTGTYTGNYKNDGKTVHVVTPNDGYATFGSMGEIKLPKEAVNNTNTEGWTASVWYRNTDDGDWGSEWNVLMSAQANGKTFNMYPCVGFATGIGGWAAEKKGDAANKALKTGDWQLATMVVTRENARMYINGVLAYTSTALTKGYAGIVSSAGTSAISSFVIGCSEQPANADDHAPGDYKGFSFYDAPLSAEALKSQYGMYSATNVTEIGVTSGEETAPLEGFSSAVYEYSVGILYEGALTFASFPVIKSADVVTLASEGVTVTAEPVAVNADGANDTEKYVSDKSVTYRIRVNGVSSSMFDKEYTVRFKACSPIADLGALTVDGKALDIAADTLEYTWNIAEGSMPDLVIRAEAADSAASADVTYRNDSKKYVIVTVTSEYAALTGNSAYTKVYKISFSEQSVNANITGISVFGQAVAGFNKKTTEYFNVPVKEGGVTAADFTATAEAGKSGVEVILSDDGLTATVRCNAEYAGVYKDYVLHLVPASTDASLGTVMIDGKALTAIDGVTEYTYAAGEGFDLSAADISANPKDGGAGVYVEKDLNANAVIITVTSEFGNTQTYTIYFKTETGCGSVLGAGSWLLLAGILIVLSAAALIRRKAR